MPKRRKKKPTEIWIRPERRVVGSALYETGEFSGVVVVSDENYVITIVFSESDIERDAIQEMTDVFEDWVVKGRRRVVQWEE